MNNTELPPYDPLEPSTTPQRNDNAHPQKQSSSNRGIVVFLTIALLLCAIGGGAYWYLNQNMPDNSEFMAYEALEGSEQLEDYEAFLDMYPESPRVQDVKERYLELKKMYEQWSEVTASDRLRDYTLFSQNYPNTSLARICDIKIDSIDWAEASAKGDQEALEEYLKKHPNGRHASEASDAHTKMVDATPTTEEKLLIEESLRGFFRAFGDNDIEAVYMLITPVMTRFLQKENATKVDVSEIIERTYNEHILSCRFMLNNDSKVKKVNGSDGEPTYKVSFTVDQYIERDDEGKTFANYRAEATVTSMYKISALTMTEISRR